MNSVRVCVTGVGGGGLGEQIVKALRLADTPYHILGTDMHAHSAGFGRVDAQAVLPRATHPEYIPALRELCCRNGIRALFYGSEAELKVLSAHREIFAEDGILLPLNPPGLIALCMDKLATFDRLRDMGFDVPWYRRVRTLEDATSFPHYPVVLKPSTNSGGSADVVIAQNDEEAILYARFLLRTHGEIVAQEYVGTPESEYTVGVLADLEGAFINSIAVHRDLGLALSRRIRVPNSTGRTELGSHLVISSGISQGAIGGHPEVSGPCEEMARRLGARGAFNIQCRVVRGRVCVFEINPRFSGTTSMRAMVGFNEPDILVRRHVLGQQVECRFPYRAGVITRRLEEHFSDLDG